MFRGFARFLLALLAAGSLQASTADIGFDQLPPEARQTLRLIQQGGPYPHERDGVVFGNFEGHLPRAQRGFYREYTVRTPGQRGRGARRIVAGGNPPRVYYYTDDHYQSFRQIRD